MFLMIQEGKSIHSLALVLVVIIIIRKCVRLIFCNYL